MECGIACLKMVCKFFGREYSFNSLSKLCTATTEGVSMLCLREAATNLGFQSKCVQTSMEDLKRNTCPPDFVTQKIRILQLTNLSSE